MDATIFFLALYDETSQTVKVVWQVENGKELSGGSFPLGNGLIGQVISSGAPRLIRNWSAEGPRVQVQYATDTPGLPESAAAVPLKLAGSTIGLMCAQSYRLNAYTYSNLRALEALADDTAIVIAGLNYSERLGEQVERRVSELEAILANMADALVIVDSRGCLVRLNRAARQLLLCPDEATLVLGQPFDETQWDNWPPEGRAAAEGLRPVVERLQQTQEPQEVEVELPGSVRRVLSFRATPLHDVDGAFTGGVIVFRDVTGERDLERLKDDMFSIASHDLKTPATVIKVQAQRLKRRFNAGSAEQDDVEEGLTMIADQADRLSKLLNLLLDLSRIEAGKLSLDRTATDLRGMLISMARALQSTTDRHLIEVDAPMGVIGCWDARRLEEVIQNLLNNAVKYSPMGGRIEVRLWAEDGNAVVTIRDSGIGLASDEAPHVFERFYRGREIRRVEGAGLGLYICHAIVAAHGGRIWGQSDGPGSGSTFGFCLPLAE
jgi:signal transduction histidine kinase